MSEYLYAAPHTNLYQSGNAICCGLNRLNSNDLWFIRGLTYRLNTTKTNKKIWNIVFTCIVCTHTEYGKALILYYVFMCGFCLVFYMSAEFLFNCKDDKVLRAFSFERACVCVIYLIFLSSTFAFLFCYRSIVVCCCWCWCCCCY